MLIESLRLQVHKRNKERYGTSESFVTRPSIVDPSQVSALQGKGNVPIADGRIERPQLSRPLPYLNSDTGLSWMCRKHHKTGFDLEEEALPAASWFNKPQLNPRHSDTIRSTSVFGFAL